MTGPEPNLVGLTAPEADLTGWTAEPFTAAGYTHDVYRKGEGPGVVLIPEMPGLHPGVMLRGCVAKEFAAFATNADRPVAHYLRALARDLNEKTPGKGVGVIGECWSGGFALAAAVDDSVIAPVLSQPSLPIGLTAKHRRDPGLSEAELKIVEKRATDDGLCALALRFSEDRLSPGARFKTLKDRLGDAFEVIEIDSKKGNEHGFGKTAHSVLTLEVREQDGHPAFEARRRVVEFLKERLV
jgi:dienelactone hydrolase